MWFKYSFKNVFWRLYLNPKRKGKWWDFCSWQARDFCVLNQREQLTWRSSKPQRKQGKN
jgi:hypothetical protein